MNATDLPVELPDSIADALGRGATVVTANQRAARTIRYAFDRWNRQLGNTTWQPPMSLAWDTWTTNLWQSLTVQGKVTELLLSRIQEHTIWRNIIRTDPELRETLNSQDSLSQLAAEAWRLLTRYKGHKRLNHSSGSAGTRAFQRWAVEFERRCRIDQLLSQSSIESALRDIVEAGQIRVTEEIVLVGFDEITPSQQSLLDILRATGTRIEAPQVSGTSGRGVLVCADNEHQEISAAANWARTLLNQQPNSRIAVIVPMLERRRSEIDRIFREVIAPELKDIAAPNNTAPYEFSLGVALAETPLVRVALDLLRWTIRPLPSERVSSLLVSPLFAMEESERSMRATFDAFELRKAKLLRPEISIGWLTALLSRSKRRSHLSHLIGTLHDMARVTRSSLASRERRSHSAWAEIARALLKAAHWGRNSEDSIEFQTRRKWEGALDDLATLDFDGTRVTFLQAMRSLELIAQQTTFAPESRQAPVQILGPLEAAGSSFDALWFLGAADLTWPAKTSCNSLLPWGLQCELSMPGTSVAADDAHARQIMRRIAASVGAAIFSYATESSEGKQRPSPVLDILQLISTPLKDIFSPESEPAVAALEEFTDTTPLPLLPDRVVRGGSEILRLQAACGFRAFAEKRLWSTELRDLELGMDAAERGNIVHEVLEHFWNEVKTQTQLKEMTTERRKEALDRAIDFGLRRSDSVETNWDRAYVDVQRERLRNLLWPWLELELKREPFSVKLSEKSSDDARIGPLRLTVRVDRVDSSEAGEIIIDYKTGAAKTSDWQSKRPDLPQLPLYAVLAKAAQPNLQLADVAFAHIQPGKGMALDGFSNKVTAAKSKSKRTIRSLEEQVDEWQNVLTDLAKAFYQGDTQVNPKKYPSTCSYCAQRTLCRLDPAAFDEDMDDETETDSGNG